MWRDAGRRMAVLTAVIYAVVFIACAGILYVIGQPDSAGESQASGAKSPQAGALPTGKRGEGTRWRKYYSQSLWMNPTEEDEEPQKSADEAGGFTGSRQYKGWKKVLPQLIAPQEELAEKPPVVVIATDLHYQSASVTDYGKAYETFVKNCDGKVVTYLPQLLEAFIDEVIQLHPDALILSGDISMNGEKINHEELAQRLARVQNAGIQVLVIPGNHDINNNDASVYFGDQAEETDRIYPDDFLEIYHAYGYDQAISRDQASLSYIYCLDERTRLLMLDSCQYDPPLKQVSGRIKPETLGWMDEQLAQAAKDGAFVIPVAHHNLLSQSRMYTTECAMNNNEEVIRLLEQYRVPLFLSGHLHVQRIRKHKSGPGEPDDAYGISEIVTDSLSIPPCQYGVITWLEGGGLGYESRSVDVSAWARQNGLDNPDLLDFSSYSASYIQDLISAQIGEQISAMGEDVTNSMARLYAYVYQEYYAGRAINPRDVKETRAYQYWERNLPESKLFRDILAMMADAGHSSNEFILPIDELEERGQLKLTDTQAK